MRNNRHPGLIAAGAFAAALSLPAAALAAGSHGGASMSVGAGGMSSSHISASGLANTNGPNATTRLDGADRATLRSNGASGGVDNDTMMSPNGGKSSSHISANGLANTNGPNATTRLHGRDRANARKALKTSVHTDTDTDTDMDTPH